MEPFTIDDLFCSVNDIYEQFDEGYLPLDEANDILQRCCEAFLHYVNQKKEA